MTGKYAQRVYNGLALLTDDHINKIDLETFSIRCSFNCVLGQAFDGGFYAGLAEIGLDNCNDDIIEKYGFDVYLDEDAYERREELYVWRDKQYAMLQRLWTYAIARRQMLSKKA